MRNIGILVLAIGLMSFRIEGESHVITPKFKGITSQSSGYEMSISDIRKGLELETSCTHCEIESYTITLVPVDGDMIEYRCYTTNLNQLKFIASNQIKAGDMILLENFKVKDQDATISVKGIYIKVTN